MIKTEKNKVLLQGRKDIVIAEFFTTMMAIGNDKLMPKEEFKKLVIDFMDETDFDEEKVDKFLTKRLAKFDTIKSDIKKILRDLYSEDEIEDMFNKAEEMAKKEKGLGVGPDLLEALASDDDDCGCEAGCSDCVEKPDKVVINPTSDTIKEMLKKENN